MTTAAERETGGHSGCYDGPANEGVLMAARAHCPAGSTTGPCADCVERITIGVAEGQARQLHRDVERETGVADGAADPLAADALAYAEVRLARIAAEHHKYVDDHGGTYGDCAECGHFWPCPTYLWATAPHGEVWDSCTWVLADCSFEDHTHERGGVGG